MSIEMLTPISIDATELRVLEQCASHPSEQAHCVLGNLVRVAGLMIVGWALGVLSVNCCSASAPIVQAFGSLMVLGSICGIVLTLDLLRKNDAASLVALLAGLVSYVAAMGTILIPIA